MSKLRIGLTGDYPPFSFLDPKTKAYTGLDVDLAKHLAQDFHQSLEIVPTTWATLATDLQAGKFDIGMGGISVTSTRAKDFLFSSILFEDEKVAVFRCADQNKFQTFSALDQSHITVIENPGGTNERVARALFKNARIHIHDNNQTIFTEILNGRADVMITDRIEAAYQQSLHPQLCWMVLPEWKEKEPKAFLFRKNSVDLCERVNAWLHEIRANGFLREAAKRWGV